MASLSLHRLSDLATTWLLSVDDAAYLELAQRRNLVLGCKGGPLRDAAKRSGVSVWNERRCGRSRYRQSLPRLSPGRGAPGERAYFDSMVFNGEGLRHLVAEYGADHVLLGTAYPFPWTTTAVDHVMRAPELSDADRAAILGGNLQRLLGIAA